MRRALFLLMLCAQACSLIGLDEYEVRECVPGVRCEDLNEGLEGECMQYACSESGRGCELRPYDRDYDGVASQTLCEGVAGIDKVDCDESSDKRFPGKAEACDAIDNDCDGYIDEGVRDDEAMDITIGARTTQVSTAAADDALLVAITQKNDAQAYAAQRLTLLGTSPSKLEPLPSGETCNSSAGADPCSFAQLAFATAGETLIGAGIHHGRCIQGHLRAGAGSASDFTLRLGELSPESGAIQLGIDVDATNGCTQHGACRGARDPALAALSTPNGGGQALLVWLSPSTDEGCVEGSAGSVLGMGLFAGTDEDDVAFVAGSNDGHGELLSDAIASGPPSIAAFQGDQAESGYFVAFPTEGSIALHFVPRFQDRLSIATELFTGGIAAEGARLAALPRLLHPRDQDSAAATGLGVAYVEQLGDRHALRFAALRFDRDAHEPFEMTSTPVQLETEGEILTTLTVEYAPDGFSAEAPRGGWLVAWIERIGDEKVLRAARIAEAELKVLGEPIELAHGAVDHAFTYLRKGADDAASTLHYGFVADDALRVSRITCETTN